MKDSSESRFSVRWEGEGDIPFALPDPWVWTRGACEFRLVPESSFLAVPGALSQKQPLTTREAQILEYLADGWTNAEIADRLGLGLRTVKFHIEGLFRKLGVGRRTEAVREGLRLGLLRL